MPSARIRADEIEGGCAWERDIENSERTYAGRCKHGKGVGDHGADVVRDDMDCGKTKGCEEGVDVASHGKLGVRGRLCGGRDAWEIEKKKMVGGGEVREGAMEGGPGLRPAVQEEEGGGVGGGGRGGAMQVVQSCAVGALQAGCEARGDGVGRGVCGAGGAGGQGVAKEGGKKDEGEGAALRDGHDEGRGEECESG